jgi:hypothetical protein
MTMAPRSPRLRRALIAVGVATGSFVGLMGFAHTPQGRPVLAWMASAGGCPVPMGGKLTVAQREQARRRQVQAARTETRAQERPALGFELDRSTRSEVTAKLADAGVSCKDRSEVAIVCSGVPAALLPGSFQGLDAELLTLSFAPDDRLVLVDVSRRKSSPEEAAQAIEAVATDLSRRAGPPARTAGERSASYLAAGTWRQARAEFRFADYIADVSATNMGEAGVLVREAYRSAND